MEPSRAPPARNPGSTWRVVSLAFGAALLLIGLSEASLRAFGYERAMPTRHRFANDLDRIARDERSAYQPDPDLFWDLRPGGTDLRAHDPINRLGMRGPEYALEKPPSTCRIAVVGGSVTYGWRLFYEQTYGARLETWLRGEYPDRRIEVLNGGVPGYSIYQGRLLFERKILPLRPDVAVFHFGGWNDLCAAIGWPDSRRNTATMQAWLAARLETLRVFQVVRSAVASIRGGEQASDDLLEEIQRAWLEGEPRNGYRVPPDEFESILDALIRTCEREGILPLLLVPDLSRAGLDPDADPERRRRTQRQLELLERYREILLEAAGRKGIATVDQRLALEGFDPEWTTFLPDAEHLTAYANLLLADALFDRIVASGQIERVPPSPEPRAEVRPLRVEPRRLPAGGGRLRFEMAAGPGNAGRPFLLLPSRTTSEVDFKVKSPRPALTRDAVTEAMHGPDRAAAFAGTLDASGRATLELVLAQEALAAAEGPWVGFVLLAAESSEDLPGDPVYSSNDVWVRIGD